jgi:hypothetical protein
MTQYSELVQTGSPYAIAHTVGRYLQPLDADESTQTVNQYYPVVMARTDLTQEQTVAIMRTWLINYQVKIEPTHSPWFQDFYAQHGQYIMKNYVKENLWDLSPEVVINPDGTVTITYPAADEPVRPPRGTHIDY